MRPLLAFVILLAIVLVMGATEVGPCYHMFVLVGCIIGCLCTAAGAAGDQQQECAPTTTLLLRIAVLCCSATARLQPVVN